MICLLRKIRPFKTVVFILLFECLLPDIKIWSLSQVDITGECFFTIDSDDLQGDAGTDLNNTHLNDAGVLTMRVYNTWGGSWQVDVKRTDGPWDSDFQLSVRRTDQGSYVEIETTDQLFTSGSGDINNVPLECRLTGVSVQIPPATYNTVVTYTIH